MSQRSAIKLELYEQCHSPSFVLIESAYMGQVKGCRITLYCTLYCTQSVLSSGYIQRLTAYELNGLSI